MPVFPVSAVSRMKFRVVPTSSVHGFGCAFNAPFAAFWMRGSAVIILFSGIVDV
jgi:hydroxymethylpyrimidine/phosphomethylpyrimidine kinase